MSNTSNEQDTALAKLLAKKYIARPDIRAVQHADGSYEPQRPSKDPQRPNRYREQLQFDMESLLAHLRGSQTYGHYMVASDDTVKLFAFDLDLVAKPVPMPRAQTHESVFTDFEDKDPREHWMSRRPGPGRNFLKYQMRCAAEQLAVTVFRELEIPVAVSYSGSKGLHVYGFTGPTTAQNAREAMRIVLDSMKESNPIGYWDLSRGKNVYSYQPRDSNTDRTLQVLTLETYPKQDSLENKDLGNLMRLPLGKHLRSPKDPTFFVDLRAPLTELAPMDPVEALTTTDPWRYAGE